MSAVSGVRFQGDRGSATEAAYEELGEAINESLSDSESIAEVVARIKEGGYDIFLVLEAPSASANRANTQPIRLPSSLPQHQCRTQDQRSGLKFLKSLRIKIDEEEED